MPKDSVCIMIRRPRRLWRRPRLMTQRICALKRAGRALVDLLPVMFALKPLLHCMNSGGELVRSTVPRDSVCIMIRPKFKLEDDAPTEPHLTAAAPWLRRPRRLAAAPAARMALYLLPARLALEPILHYMNGGGELLEKHRAEGQLCIMTRRPRRR